MAQSTESDVKYKEFVTQLGARIKMLRKERGYSLRDMIIRFGYNDSQWRKYERGGSISLQSLWKIAQLFEIPITDLLDGLDVE
jgi:transcriptional regulator with XRE-family HTH domain